jgi:cell division protein FtsZ
VLLNISGGSDLGLFEVNEAAEVIASAAHPDANIIFGAVIDDALGDEVRVTVIAAGFDRTTEQANAENGRAQAGSVEEESVWPTPGMRRPADNRVTRPASAASSPAAERREPERREPERREPERRPRYDGDDDELDIPSFLKR